MTDLAAFGFSREEARKVAEIKARPVLERFPNGKKGLYKVHRSEKLCPACSDFVLDNGKCFCGYKNKAGSANY